jgi:hypothetical protein
MDVTALLMRFGMLGHAEFPLQSQKAAPFFPART